MKHEITFIPNAGIQLLLVLLMLSFSLFAGEPGNVPGQKRPTVGLVLSGGGAKGFAYVGLLKVIQEAGLRIDYIGGSSIGSIVGGLYALGYSPDTIAKMIRSQNWDHVLKDIINRKYIAYEEKEYGENAILSLPIRDQGVSISPALYAGQEVNLLLNRYFSPAYKTTDFRTFPTPFLCIATDLEDGQQVILDQGYLPMAIRASMSIPGYFCPTDYNGRYLVDGGVVNNYPVREVKEMGAQIIVGGDVQAGLCSKNQLTSITSILDQVMSFYRINSNMIGDSLTNLHVRIKMKYGMMDFENYDSIIAIGERVARSHFREIKALADSLNAIEFRPLKKYGTRPLDSVFVNDVVIRGNEKMPDKYFLAVLPKVKNCKVSLTALENAIHHLYGTCFFEHVFYEFQVKEGKTVLVIDAKEVSPGSISAAIHYDNDYNGSLVINSAFRNLTGNRTKIFADLVLGVNPRLKALYMVGLGGKLNLDFSIDFYSFKFNIYDKDVKTNKIVYTDYKASLFLDRSFNNMVNLKFGLDYEYFRFKEDIVSDSPLEDYGHFVSYGTLFVSLNADTRDRPYFPTRGTNASLRAEYVMPWSKIGWVGDLFSNSAVIYLKYDQNISLSRKFVFQPGVFAGAIINSSAETPVQHLLGFGGLNATNYVGSYVDFTGVQFIQQFGYYAAIVRLKMQYNFYKKLYLTARSDFGSNQATISAFADGKNLLAGYGLTAGYNSFIGPVELTVMGSNINPKPLLFLNIGFRL